MVGKPKLQWQTLNPIARLSALRLNISAFWKASTRLKSRRWSGQPGAAREAPIVKAFLGLADIGGERRALFYLTNPSMLISAPLCDVLWAAKLKQERQTSAAELIKRAGPALAEFVSRHGILGNLQSVGFGRWSPWGESMKAIYALLREMDAAQQAAA
ncbi:hypothetical protein [uncultured Devosia sp.]|uniref:hypothetical protein n=1 Tax=uncultured Devosia sp. TaxID=211434 RepID=UPI0026288F81|nr:hypothetical protein [uncultured Devosia sp.]